MKLPPAQVAVLRALEGLTQPTPIAELASAADLDDDRTAGAVFALAEDGYLSIETQEHEGVSLTEEGQRYVADGLPELRLHDAVVQMAGVDSPLEIGTAAEQAELAGDEVQIALANIARKEYGRIDDGAVIVTAFSVDDSEATALSAIADDGSTSNLDDHLLDQLERRNLIDRTERTNRRVSLTDAGRSLLDEGLEARESIGQVTPRVLTTGEWREAEFHEYNVEADAPVIHGGSEHVLRRTAERVKDVLIGMGFREMEGPTVDADFWINDCLFMPQDHPARTHWDRFELEDPRRIDDLPEDLVERVERAHREGVGTDGDGYSSPWSEDIARSLALRGHTTSLTARHLAGIAMGDLEPPQRFYSVEKAYRNDTIDATHLLEFFQIEGWVMAESLSVRDLMGTFTEFYAHFGITDLEFKPHYNPYTEPSFELFGTHPRTGELIEIGNSGIFRPEMLEPLGVDCDVMAWGLALERLMMLVTGAEDIRDVHGTLVDLDFLRTEQVVS